MSAMHGLGFITMWIALLAAGPAQNPGTGSTNTVTVRGRVANVAREASFKNRIVQLGSIAGGPTVLASVKPDYSFEFFGVPAGTYRVSVVGFPGSNSIFPTITVGTMDVENVTIDLVSNPFPEFPGGAFSSVFDVNKQAAIRGVVTEAVTPQVSPPALTRYFRVEVKDDVTGVVTPWAVMLLENVKLSVGETVRVVGVGAHDGTNRISLNPIRNTTATINGIPVNPTR
jgi:hypothetical protein